MVAVLACTRHLKLHSHRVPCADACNLTKTAVSLARQARAAPPCDHTIVSSASGGTNNIAHLILVEHISHLHLLLEKPHREINFLLNGASIDLNFFDVCLLLTNLH